MLRHLRGAGWLQVPSSTQCASLDSALAGKPLLTRTPAAADSVAGAVRTPLGATLGLDVTNPAPTSSGTLLRFHHNLTLTLNNTMCVALGATSTDSTLCLWLSLQVFYFVDGTTNTSRRLRHLADASVTSMDNSVVVTGAPLSVSLPGLMGGGSGSGIEGGSGGTAGQAAPVQFSLSFVVTGVDVLALTSAGEAARTLRSIIAQTVRTAWPARKERGPKLIVMIGEWGGGWMRPSV